MMFSLNHEAHFTQDALTRTSALFVFGISESGRVSRASNITFETIKDAEQGGITPPLLTGQPARTFVQSIMDAAWDAGLRPTGFLDVRESMKASNAHLQDMRAIAFGKLGLEKPL